MVTFVHKRLQVFVSSTYTDLIAERQAAVEAVLTAGHMPAGMELFASGDESQMEVIKQWIDESDVFLLILGGRYGSTEQKTGKSYTQLEYEYAFAVGKPSFACVITNSALESRVKTHGMSMIDIDHSHELNSFRALVLSKQSSFWEDCKDIKIAITGSLSQLARRDELCGWVRANQEGNMPALADEIARLSKENAQLRGEIARTREVEEHRHGPYEKYVNPLAADAVNLLWRLDEIIVKQRGQYLLEDAPPTPFNQLKRISTCYRLAAVLAWIRAIRLEQSYLSYADPSAFDALRRAVGDFESALADSPNVEMEVVGNLARLWDIELPPKAEAVARVAAQIAADMQHFLSKYALVRYYELASLKGETAMEVMRHISGSITRMLDHAPIAEQVLIDTCPATLKIIGVRQASIYRDWQQAIGDLMLRTLGESVRRFDVIGYGAFETLYREDNSPWVAHLRDVVIGIDVARPESGDLRLQQLRQVARATASLVCSIETLDLEGRVLDPKTVDLARKFLAELPAMADAAA